MPMYDYQCASCGHQLEAIQKISAAPLVDCPACQAPELKKMLSMPGFRLSGSGWYETDFKTGAKKNLAGGDKADWVELYAQAPALSVSCLTVR
ncbi:zinc ribbon domain-containing protein [Pseudomonas haemolytica]|nr:zinc ribbon domain-containing protein [Pseudomonas haemolytica]MBK3462110.1 zinc ribbon domain-containing protein [Pseudomonas haemolytica]